MSGLSFPASNYDFRNVISQSDVRDCCYYEFSRESQALIDEVNSVKRQIAERSGKSAQLKFSEAVKNQVQSHLVMALSLVGGFPNAAWLDLAEKERRHFSKFMFAIPDVTRYALTWRNPPLSFSIKESDTATLRDWKQKFQEGRLAVPNSDSIKFGFFRVNLEYGHEVLLEEFEKYLRHFEGKPMLEYPPVQQQVTTRKPRGRKSIRDTLNALGIMRLRFHCATFTEAREIMEGMRSNGMFYGRRESANRACGQARRYFKEVFGWIDAGDPIRFTHGWRGGH